MKGKSTQTAFSLVELVIVVVIIGIVAAIAVPHFSRASADAEANALLATLANVRSAIDHYYAEHGRYPGYDPSTDGPDSDAFIDQLTKYTDYTGNVSDSLDSTHIYGPYLRRPFPINPINDLATVAVKATTASAVSINSTGWVTCLQDGVFNPNNTVLRINSFFSSAKLMSGSATPTIIQ